MNVFDPGALDKRMILEDVDDTPDGAGGAVRVWETAEQFWAELRPVSMRGATADGSTEQRITHYLTYRAGPELTRDKRLRLGTRLFSIFSVRDVDDSGVLKQALIEEIVP